MKSCIDCRYFVSGACAAPQLVDLARLVSGAPVPGITIPAFLARLNQATCGTPAYWFAANPPPAPVTQELPASAS